MFPCISASFRPVGNIDHAVIIIAVTAPYRKAEVITYLQINFPSFKIYNNFFISRSKYIMLFGHPEKMSFIVIAEAFVRPHPDETIVEFSVFFNDQAASYDAAFFI